MVYNDTDGEPLPADLVAETVAEYNRAFNCANASALTAASTVSMAQALDQCGWTGRGVGANILEWEGTSSDEALPVDEISLPGWLPDGTYM